MSGRFAVGREFEEQEHVNIIVPPSIKLFEDGLREAALGFTKN
jgi:hypothetical protein